MPAQAPPVADERSALVAYLVQQQDAFRAAVYGLSDAQAGIASAPPSTLTVGSLLKHVTQTQGSWLEVALAAPDRPVDDRTMQEQYADHAEGWTWHDHDTIEAALASYDAVCTRVIDAVRSADPDTAVPVEPDGRRRVVGPVGLVPPHRGAGQARRARRHRPRAGGRRDDVRAGRRPGGLARDRLAQALATADDGVTTRRPETRPRSARSGRH